VVIGGVGSWQRTDTDRTAGAYPKLNKLPLEGGCPTRLGDDGKGQGRVLHRWQDSNCSRGRRRPLLCPVELQRLGGKGRQDLRRERESNA
jgi:hypothetical protein